MAESKLFLVFLIAVVVEISEACMCYYNHPQTKYCNSQLVFKAKLLDNGNEVSVPFFQRKSFHVRGRSYDIKITHVYKGVDKLGNISSPVTTKLSRSRRSIMFSSFVSLYGCLVSQRQLKTGGTYILGGMIVHGRLQINTCDLVLPLDNLSSEEKNVIRNLFKREFPNSCECKISGYRSRRPNTCDWNYRDKCATVFQYCAKDKNGKCHMRSTPAAKACRSRWIERMP